MAQEYCERHQVTIEANQEQIKDLYQKVGALATLPEKVDAQTKILERIANDISVLPEHRAQLAVLTEILQDYKEHKKAEQEFRLTVCASNQIILAKLNPEQIQKDHDSVAKMTAEWGLIKYAIPIGITILNIITGVVMHFWK